MSFIPRGKIVVSIVNAEGKGVFAPDLEIPVETLPGGATLRRVFNSPSVPVTGINYNSKDEHGNLANENGFTLLECEMIPGQKSPMHATPSIDFGFLITGEVTLILDSGEEKVLKPGDMYIQKAACHAWENRTSQPCRFATVLVASRP